MNNKLLSEILAQCLDDIKSGRADIEECLNQYPAYRQELEPLLSLAVHIQPPEVEPSDEFRENTRMELVKKISALPAPVTKQPSSRLLYQKNKNLNPLRRLKMIPAIVSIVLALSMAGGGTAYAAQSSLPGDGLYEVKLASEQVGLAFTFGESSKVEQHLVLAQKRINEAEALMNQNRPDDLPQAGEQYGKALERLQNALQNVPEDVSASIAEQVAQSTGRHLLVLNDIYNRVPDEAKAGIENAINVSMTGQTKALETLATADPEKAANTYLSNLDNLLGQIETMAGNGNSEAVVKMAAEFEELENFGQTISEIAQGLGTGDSTVDELLAAAHTIHREVLDRINEIVPEQAREAIEQARQNIPGNDNANGPTSDLPVTPPVNSGNGDSENGSNNPASTVPPETTQPGPPAEVPAPPTA